MCCVLVHVLLWTSYLDRDAVQKLDSKMREERKTCGEMVSTLEELRIECTAVAL